MTLVIFFPAVNRIVRTLSRVGKGLGVKIDVAPWSLNRAYAVINLCESLGIFSMRGVESTSASSASASAFHPARRGF